MDFKAWYEDGLRFTCSQCGKCCTGFEGYVWVNRDEMLAIAKHLSMSLDSFTERYVRKVGRRHSLIEKRNYDCIFWEDGTGCTIYPARPTQCRTFPFWPENIENTETWKETVNECPGAGRGRHYSREEIEHLSAGTGETGPPSARHLSPKRLP